MQQGPFDISNVKCYEPVGCCPLDPCKVTKEDFICAVRTLLPEGPLFNPAIAGDPLPEPVGTLGVGCLTVGCQPVCGEGAIPDPGCTDTPQQMQINMVDVYASTAFTSLEAYCCMLKELDPCTAVNTVDRWLERYGVLRTECDPEWTPEIKSLLLCMLSRVSNNFVLNKRNLDALAAYFAVKVTIYTPGDFNCGPEIGGWTLYRGRSQGGTPTGCRVEDACDGSYQYLLGLNDSLTYERLLGSNGFLYLPLQGRGDESPVEEKFPSERASQSFVRWGSACVTLPSIDLVVCQAETVVPANCLLPGAEGPVEPSADLYEAFLWLLNRLVGLNVDICIYRCDDAPCLENN